MSDIFEQKPWLNDDPQTVDTLKKNLGIDGGSGLPEIGDGDNGKVLTANVSGSTKSATWETPSGGGDVFLVTLTSSPSGGTLNKNYNEISEALSSGKIVYISEIGEGGGMFGYVLNTQEDAEHNYYAVSACMLVQTVISITFSSSSPTGTLEVSF